MKTIKVSLLSEERLYAKNIFPKSKNILDDNEIIEIEFDINENNKSTINGISSIVMEIIRDKILKDYIDKEYSQVYPNEKDEIYTYSLEILKTKEPFIEESIRQKLLDYIKSNDYINLDGFVNFRMKNFKKYISAVTDRAVEEYIIKKDQDEFIKVLKYFIEIQDDKIDLVKVHIKDEDTFLLYDKNGNIINGMNNEDIVNMVIEENLNSEDFLISTLLSLCPKKIEILDTLKNNISKEIIETIKSIFGDKASTVYQN
ncbi:putative sporulation protein YtxC [Romboutsia sp. 1001713B170131_170501_G6]|uniref:putative sporulation protein YtxC n=1 Tax=Romboutsia sp. 1001713B170131_170501_G6 TaxID=2787108 RepID=UPI0018AB92B5|nr:putative sporulation protein YtxC [Romboutsia sp. 1001713B170131_170501_G6]